jgi:hypothetical protein
MMVKVLIGRSSSSLNKRVRLDSLKGMETLGNIWDTFYVANLCFRCQKLLGFYSCSLHVRLHVHPSV